MRDLQRVGECLILTDSSKSRSSGRAGIRRYVPRMRHRKRRNRRGYTETLLGEMRNGRMFGGEARGAAKYITSRPIQVASCSAKGLWPGGFGGGRRTRRRTRPTSTRSKAGPKTFAPADTTDYGKVARGRDAATYQDETAGRASQS